jgi:hypothetical protein
LRIKYLMARVAYHTVNKVTGKQLKLWACGVMCNTMLVPMKVTSGSCEYKFQYSKSHRWVTGLYHLSEAQSS